MKVKCFIFSLVFSGLIIGVDNSYACHLNPIADLIAIPSYTDVGSDITFDGSASYDPDGPTGTGGGLREGIKKFEWDFNYNESEGFTPDYFETVNHYEYEFDGITTHSYDTAGTYKVMLRVTDNDASEGGPPNKSDTMICDVTVGLLYVDKDATGVGDGSSWANAYHYLRYALAAAESGDEIRVAEGVYAPTDGIIQPPPPTPPLPLREATFSLNNGVTIKGGYAGYSEPDPDARDINAYKTILSGDIGDPGDNSDNSYHVVTGAGDTIFDGFTITSGNANGTEANSHGGGIYCASASPTISNCTISNNNASSQGGGLYCYNASPAITSCTVFSNNADFGGGIYIIDSTPTVTNCVFSDNTVSEDGGGIYNYNSDMEVINCTFSKNYADGEGGGIHITDSSPTITNCIFWDNEDTNGQGENSQIQGGSPVINYSCIEGWTGTLGGVNNSGENPSFGNADDPAGSDGIFGTWDDGLALSYGSPCVDVGDNTAATTQDLIIDIVGKERIVDGDHDDVDEGGVSATVDMGAYELPTIWFVDKDKTDGGNTGTSWDDAFVELKAALTSIDADEEDEIWVAEGIYKPDQASEQIESFVLKEGVGVYGGFSGEEIVRYHRDWVLHKTTLSGDIGTPDEDDDNSYNVVRGVDNAIIDGFTITKGRAVSEPPPLPSYPQGGGMYNANVSPTVINCTFIDNSADWSGGGMFNYISSGTMKVINCFFSDNTAGINGGGLYNYGSTMLTNCTFIGNSSISNGGAIYNDHSSSTLTNCTFNANTADVGGGIYNLESNPTISNCILWDNTAPSGPQIYGGNPNVTFCDIQGGWSGTGNIEADPGFGNANNPAGSDGIFGTSDDGLALIYGSPCVDTGDNATIDPFLPKDTVGKTRIVDGDHDDVDEGGVSATVDMGAYELPTIWFVDKDAVGSNEGVSWLNAFVELKTALTSDDVDDEDEIWVAEGTYKPTEDTVQSISFTLGEGVGIYGGFSGTENVRYMRDWMLHKTILSGDIGNEGDLSDNSYHVVKCGHNAILDGFTITGGNAESAGEHACGGGMLNVNASPVILNCTFSGNLASHCGGGMYNMKVCDPILINCMFSGNVATLGGGMYNSDDARPTMTNCTFSGNTATSGGIGGGGIYNLASDTILTNCIFWGNSDSQGNHEISQIYNGQSASTFINYCCVQGWTGDLGGNGNFDGDPLFVRNPNDGPDGTAGTEDDDYGNLHLQSGSPCIDRGSNDVVPFEVTTDLDVNPRFIDDPSTVDNGAPENDAPYVDIGADEYQLLSVDAGEAQEITLPVDTVNLDGTVTGGIPGSVITTWSQDSGPSDVEFGDPAEVDTIATFPIAGTYTLRLSAEDGATIEEDTVIITVNEPLTVDAGANQEITLPTDTVNLNGTVIPETATKTWSEVSGPGTVTFGDELSEDTTATFDEIGIYVLKLSADDGETVVSDTVKITVMPGPGPGNHLPPIVEAGADKYIDLGDILHLDDSKVTDDGIPNPPGAISVQWSVVSGGFPGDVTFANSSQVQTTATITRADTYVLRLEASDGELTGEDTLIVTVDSGNLPPVIDAGDIEPIQLPGSFPTLAGVVVWDEEPSTVAPTWSVVRVPEGGEVVFNPSPPHTWDPQVTFNRDGDYVLQLDAVDAEGLTAKPDLVMITVRPQLIVDAGDNQEIAIDNTVLDGEIKNDPLELVDSKLWTKVLPLDSTVTFGDEHSEDTTVTFSELGDYVLRLEAKNASGEVIGSDEVHIRISSPPTEYSSYVFSVDDLIFFSYEDELTLSYQECDEFGNPIGDRQPVNGDESLDKGQHAIVDGPRVLDPDATSTGVYKVFSSSMEFSVLTGDPTVEKVSGYYAMNPDSSGVGTEFYTYIPLPNASNQYFVITAYEAGTTVTVKGFDSSTGNYDISIITDWPLDAGQHWSDNTLSGKYIHVRANMSVSVLTSHDAGYYVPSSNGKWSGEEFYTFIDSHEALSYDSFLRDLWIIAYDDYTAVTIERIVNNVIDGIEWSGTLHSGKSHIHIGGPVDDVETEAYIRVTSNNPITVNVGPVAMVVEWYGSLHMAYQHGDFIPDRKGTGIGTDFIGRCVDSYTGDPEPPIKAYFYILAYMDETNVRVYNSEDGTFKADYTLNAGKAINANAFNDSDQPEENFLGEGLWRIVSDKPVSVQSGSNSALAEYVPLDFNVKDSISEFRVGFGTIVIEGGGDCVLPVDTSKNTITYTIEYGNSLAEPVYGVKIVDHLPKVVDFISADHAGYYEASNHTFTREIGTLGAGESDSFTIMVKVNDKAKPSGTISNLVEIESLDYYDAARADDVSVCGWAAWTEQNIIYVNENATGSNNGTCWQDAYTDLQDALDTAQQLGEAEIWVAEGTYTPRSKTEPYNRSMTFQLINGVMLYGGFPGGETSLEDRDWQIHETILSGDINGDDVEVVNPADLKDHETRDENCFHVVTGSGTDNTAVLDGFVIRGGNANISNEYLRIYEKEGAGMYNENGSPMVRNCTFSHNSAWATGGGMYNYYSSPELINCKFYRNSSREGGGIYNDNESNPKLIDCGFINNHSRSGGGMYNSCGGSSISTKPELTDCIFRENLASDGGGMYNAAGNCDEEGGFEVTLVNCTFIRNSATESAANDNSSAYGGGIYNTNSSSKSSLKLTNCIFNGNIAEGSEGYVDYGGGIHNNTYMDTSYTDCGFDLNLVNCVFSGNSASTDGYGGGISNYFKDWQGTQSCSLTLTNCTFASNTAYEGRTLFCYSHEIYPSSSTVLFTNCILWNGGNEIQKDDESVITINYSYVWDISQDPPLFIQDPDQGADGEWGTEDDSYGDLRLDSGSPCIDAAGNDAVLNLNIETDLNGDPRRIDDPETGDTGNGTAPIVDMGAYERQLLTVDAGSYDPSVLTLLPTNEVSLYLNHAAIVPPNPPGELTRLWSMSNGPDDVAFDNDQYLDPIVTFYTPGTYVLKLEAFVDGQLAGSDTVTIKVRLDVNAGEYDDVTIYMGEGTLDLVGIVTGGVYDTVLWSKASGKCAVSFDNSSSLTSKATFTEVGEYVLRLEARNTSGEVIGWDDAIVMVHSYDQQPVVEAGSDQTYILPTGDEVSHTLEDAWYADGIPPVQEIQWSVDGEPPGVTFDPYGLLEVKVTANFTKVREYVLRLVAKDDIGTVIAEDTVTITIISDNKAPIVNAGYYRKTGTLPNCQIVMSDASVFDDYTPVEDLEILWTSVPDTGVGFSDREAVQPTVTFTETGDYLLTLQATDDASTPLTGSDIVWVTIYPEDQITTVNAGPDIITALLESDDPEEEPSVSIYLEDAFVVLGTPGEPSAEWSVISGPDLSLNFYPAASFVNPIVTFEGEEAEGDYTLKLTVWIDGEEVSSDTMDIIVGSVGSIVDDTTPPTMTNLLELNGEQASCGSSGYGELMVRVNGADSADGDSGVRKVELRWGDETGTLLKEVIGSPSYPAELQLKYVVDTQSLTIGQEYTFYARVTDKMFSTCSGTCKFTPSAPTSDTDPPIAKITNSIFYEDGEIIPKINPMPIISDGLFILEGEAYHTVSTYDVFYKIELFKNEIGKYEEQYWNPTYTLYHDYFVKNVTPGAGDDGFCEGSVKPELGQIPKFPESLDFTGVENGTYQMLLTVKCQNIESYAHVGFVLDCPLKLGNIKFSQEDLVIPVSGVPLRVVRTYDSLRRNLDGEFGHGWTYTVADMDFEIHEERTLLLSDPELGKGEDRLVRWGSNNERNVNLTLPDGRRVMFPFYLLSDGADVPTYTAKFMSPYGMDITLQTYNDPDTDVEIMNSLGLWDGQGSGLVGYEDPATYDFRSYLLTTEDDTQYFFEREDYGADIFEVNGMPYWAHPRGQVYLNRIKTPTGETIEFNVDLATGEIGKFGDKGIEHKGIDGQVTKAIEVEYTNGRITAIYAPSEKGETAPTIKYMYDENNGNLTEVHKLVVKDDLSTPLEDETDYEIIKYIYDDDDYDPDDHYITKIIDPRGLNPVIYEYDEEGRLVYVYDAKGNQIHIDHSDTANKTETVTDRSGNSTVYQYDNRGNVVSVTNSLDQTTSYIYGDTEYSDAPSEVWVPLVPNADPANVEDYAITTTDYDTSGRPLIVTDPEGNITENSYDSRGNLLTSTQKLPLPDESEVITTENVYYANRLIFTGTRKGDPPTWHSMTLSYYYYDPATNFLTGTNYVQVNMDPGQNIKKEDVFEVLDQKLWAIENLPGSGHAVTSYQYDLLSDSHDQPYSITDPAGLTRYFKYDENNNQVASWYFWDDVKNNPPDQEHGYDKCVITLSNLDVQGRTIKTRSVVQDIANEENPSDPDIDVLLAGNGGIILSQTVYNSIGKADTVYDEHGNYTQYDYDETGSLLETRTYDSDDNLLTTTQTLYDAEGRVLVTVGPYATGDRPVGTETVYDALGRVAETRRWENVAINLVDLVVDNKIVGKTVNPNATISNAWDDGDDNPDAAYDAGWTSNGRIPVVDVADYSSIYHEIPLSHTRTIYDIGGRVKHSVALDENCKEQPTTYYYDKAGKQTIIIDPEGHQNLTYEENTITGFLEIDFSDFDDTEVIGNLTGTHKTITQYLGTQRSSVTDARDYETSFQYDDLGRLVKTTHPQAQYHDDFDEYVTYSHLGYDGLGRKKWQTESTREEEIANLGDADGLRSFDYDVAGRLTKVTLSAVAAGTPVYEYFYDDYGNQIAILDPLNPLNRMTIFKYDHLNRQTTRYMPFAVDPATITDTKSIYDALANASPTPNSEEHSYDNLGRLEMIKDYKGRITSFEYNNHGQLWYKKYYIDQTAYDTQDPSETIEYAYDNLGRKYQIIEARGTTTYYYNNEGKVYQVDTPEGTINYTYNPITGRKTNTSTASGHTNTNYYYDELGRLAGTGTASENTYYHYDEAGNRKWLCIDRNGDFDNSDPAAPTGYEIKTDYTYDPMNRQTDLLQQKTGEDSLSSYYYTLKADGHRHSLDETLNETRNITYGYDDLNRLTSETADLSGVGYTSTYQYDLAGNRTQRQVTVNGQVLTTAYDYYPGTDKLYTETHIGPVYAVYLRENDRYYAYASPNGGHFYQDTQGRMISSLRAFFMGLPSVWARYMFILAMAIAPVLMSGPAVKKLISRMLFSHGEQTRLRLRVPRKGICLLVAFVMLLGPESFHNLSRAEVQYANLNTASWANGDTTITYTYDDNGSVETKTTVTSSVVNEVVTYHYNLAGRLEKVTTDDQAATEHVAEYIYNDEGIRVQAYSYDQPTGGGAKSNEKTVTYLVDSYNHTGYAQVLEGWTVEGSTATLTCYTLGDDVIAQKKTYWQWVDSQWELQSTDNTQYLLYDGHGSTRQLAEYNTEVSIVDDFSYDVYGVLLQNEDNFLPNGTQMPGKVAQQATNLLYTGEHFDTDLQNYYLRARWYNSLSGRFNRMDPFPGNKQYPQSLHKYRYAHSNPINGTDPSGLEFSLVGMIKVATISGCISGILTTVYGYAKGWSSDKILDAQIKAFIIGFGVGAGIYALAWSVSALWTWLVSGGAITAKESAKYGYESLNDLRDAWRNQGFNISNIQHIHHFVSKVPANIQQFGAKAIHSLANTIPLDNPTHLGRLHSYTNSSTTTLNLTQYIGQHYSHLHQYIVKLSWEAQYAWGLAMYNYVQINGSMEGFNPVSHGLL